MNAATRRAFAPRLLILAFPAGVYVTITRAAETTWGEAAVYGGVVLGLVLFGPALIRGASKGLAAANARSKAKAAKAKADEEKGAKK